MSMDQSQQPGLGQLPYSVLSLLVNQLSPTGQGVLRATASHERTGVDAVVQSVTSRADLLNLPKLLLRLKALKSLTLASGWVSLPWTGWYCRQWGGAGCDRCRQGMQGKMKHPTYCLHTFSSTQTKVMTAAWTCRSFSSSPACYSELSAHVPAVVDSLAALTSLTSLTLSATAAQQLGALRWAHMESQNVAKGAGPTFISRIAEATGVQQRPSPLDQFYWVPDWLAAAPSEPTQPLVHHTLNYVSSTREARQHGTQTGFSKQQTPCC